MNTFDDLGYRNELTHYAYVSTTVKHLFETLQLDGFDHGLRGDKLGNIKNYWYYKLPDEYKEFSGNYHDFREDVRQEAHKFIAKVGSVTLTLAPPQSLSKVRISFI